MKLISFHTTDYRSIRDSGLVKVDRITALVGRNESGKSNLLRALHSVEPPEGFKSLNKKKDFPRHRRLAECTDQTLAVVTRWELDDGERKTLATKFPRAKDVTVVSVHRRYDDKRIVYYDDLPDLQFDRNGIAAKLKSLKASTEVAAENVTEDKKAALLASSKTFQGKLAAASDARTWASAAVLAIEELRKALVRAEGRLDDSAQEVLDEMDELASEVSADGPAEDAADAWVLDTLPVFIFLDDYPEIPGQQNIAEYLSRKANAQLKQHDLYFEKLLKVAGLSAAELNDLKNKNDAESRNLLVNRASAVVTAELKRLWKDRQLKVRFNIDGDWFETLVSDPTDSYDVEVNLDERSRGFKWFFSFYVSFAADTDGGTAESAILLLDEPGLFLHALSQEDLLVHFENDFENQILYTTHSPFMVPPRLLSAVRTVNISQDDGTTVTNEPTGDRRTLFPLQSALGYSLAQSLFIGPRNVVVEGVTDFWIVSAVAEHFRASGKKTLSDDIVITPCGGAQRASYMVALLTSQRLDVVLLLDDESEARAERERLVREKLIRGENVVLVSTAFTAAPAESDIEDLLDPSTYQALVEESYASELGTKALNWNSKIPRVAKRAEDALTQHGIKFSKTRPANLFMRKMATDPSSVLNKAARERFDRLFVAINERVAKLAEAGRPPFR